jgi:hypothetical protein
VAVYTPVAPGFAKAHTPIAVSATDTIPVQSSGRYLLIVRNAGGTVDNVSIDDPNTTVPPGSAASSTFADVIGTVPITTGEMSWILDAARHRDAATGNITVTHSFITTVTAVVIGPL